MSRMGLHWHVCCYPSTQFKDLPDVAALNLVAEPHKLGTTVLRNRQNYLNLVFETYRVIEAAVAVDEGFLSIHQKCFHKVMGRFTL